MAYYSADPGMTVADITRRWMAGDKMYDSSMPYVMDADDLWKYRDYTWTRETGRAGWAYPYYHDKEQSNLPPAERWDKMKSHMDQHGWDDREPLMLTVGKDGKAKIGEGNHRLAIWRNELHRKQVPVRIFFYQTCYQTHPPLSRDPQSVENKLYTGMRFSEWLSRGDQLIQETEQFARKLIDAGINIDEIFNFDDGGPARHLELEPSPRMRLVKAPRRRRIAPPELPGNLDRDYNDLLDRWTERYGSEERAEHHLRSHLWRVSRGTTKRAAQYRQLMAHKGIDSEFPHLKVYKGGNYTHDEGPVAKEPNFYPTAVAKDAVLDRDIETKRSGERININTTPPVSSRGELPEPASAIMPKRPGIFSRFGDWMKRKLAVPIASTLMGR